MKKGCGQKIRGIRQSAVCELKKVPMDPEQQPKAIRFSYKGRERILKRVREELGKFIVTPTRRDINSGLNRGHKTENTVGHSVQIPCSVLAMPGASGKAMTLRS